MYLDEEEKTRVVARMNQAWSRTRYYWYPLAPCVRDDVLALFLSRFEAEVPYDAVQEILRRFTRGRVYWLRESEASEIVRDEDLPYGEPESYLCDDSMDWIVYTSHEDSITFGGVRLIAAVKRGLPSWQDHVWRS